MILRITAAVSREAAAVVFEKAIGIIAQEQAAIQAQRITVKSFLWTMSPHWISII